MVLETVRGDALCGRLMSIPGVGPITALAFKTGVDTPERFAKSKTVGAHFGLTPRKFNGTYWEYVSLLQQDGPPNATHIQASKSITPTNP